MSLKKTHSYLKKNIFKTALLAVPLLLGQCGSHVKSIQYHFFGPTSEKSSLRPNTGIVVTDEPQASLVGRDVLARGGNAADAAVATAFALSVTLPSRISLGGGGACLVSPQNKPAEAIIFISKAGHNTGTRPSGVPMLPRGLFILQDHYGVAQFSDDIQPAIIMANQGVTVSDALNADLQIVGDNLLDHTADDDSDQFSYKTRQLVKQGDQFVQKRLGSFLSRLSLVGVNDLYNGVLGDVFLQQANKAGAGLTKDDMRQNTVMVLPAFETHSHSWDTAYLPSPADGGFGSAVALKKHTSAESAIATWRAQNTMSMNVFYDKAVIDNNKKLPPLPASTSFTIVDGQNMAVSCSLSNNNLFGTGRIAGSTGVLLSGSPIHYPRPLLTSIILRNQHKELRGIISASGQNNAADAAAIALTNIAAYKDIGTPTEQGRINSITCIKNHCQGRTDPRGHGLSSEAHLPR